MGRSLVAILAVLAVRPALAAPGLSCQEKTDWKTVLLWSAAGARLEEVCRKNNGCLKAGAAEALCVAQGPLDDAAAVKLLKADPTCAGIEGALKSRGVPRAQLKEVPPVVPPAVSSDWQTRVIDGFTGFVAKRAKAEAASFVFDGIGRKLCAAGEGELAAKQLFEGTCSLAEASNRARLLMSPGRLVRESMRADLVQLPAKLAAGTGDQGTACTLAVVASVGAGVAANEDPLLALVDGLKHEKARWPKCFPSGATDPWAKIWPIVEAVACQVTAASGATQETWAANPEALVDELARNLGEAEIPWLRPVLSDLVPRAVRVELLVKGLREKTAKEGELEAARQLAGASLELAAAVALGRERHREGTSAEAQARLEKVATIARRLAAGEFAAGISALVGSDLLGKGELNATVVRYAPFIAEVGEARSSDEVAAAFELAAAPAGSWRFKRTEVALGIGARAGVLGANEYANGRNSKGYTLGPWVPLGFDVSIPCHGSALGIFVQALDAGTLGTTRLTSSGDQQAKAESRVGFAQIVSPGVAVYLGIGNSPFVLSLGASMVPGLRDVEGDGRGGTNVRRFGVGLGIDIPVFLW